MKIENVNLEITDACNLRCTMCDIWKEKKNNYFTAGMINDIFSSDVLSEAVDVTLTGGEVFLHPELFSLVERIQHFRPKGIRTLSTNG
ncbi:MAG: radical SAM protein, partial [Candidatus Omnitrophica bacterium]|nr:radical SAM protein [Candidatus Omnitrophota bacterium]